MITVSPSRNMELFNWLINHADIAPHVRDDSMSGKIDVSPLNNYANIFLRVDSTNQPPVGFATMISRSLGVYEQHSGMREGFRGHNALRAGREVLKWMFLNTDCETVTTWAWSSAKHVMMMARALGFIEESRVKWPNKVRGETVDRVIYSQTIVEWSRRAKDDFVEDSVRLNLGVEPCMMGFDAMFVRMALAGQVQKAHTFFNRWAAVFAVQPMQIFAVRAGSIVVCAGPRVIEVTPDLLTSVIQSDSLCQSSQQSHI